MIETTSGTAGRPTVDTWVVNGHKWAAVILRGDSHRDSVYLVAETKDETQAREWRLAKAMGAAGPSDGSYPCKVKLGRFTPRHTRRRLTNVWLGGTMAEQEPAPRMPRHVEAELARDIGTAPVVELHGMVKVRAGRVVGLWLGPHDMAEMLAVQGFTTDLGRDEDTTRVGVLQGVNFYLMEEDLP